MSISIDFGQHQNYEISESRLSKMMQGDRKTATDVSIWEKFKDLFRTDKKGGAYHELYNILHGDNDCDQLDAFNRLKSLAKQEEQVLFKKEIFHDKMVFFIGHDRIGETSIQKLINVFENTPLISMSRSEQSLFLEMLDTLRDRGAQFTDRTPSYIRNSASYEHCYSLLDLYRPQESMDEESTEWRMKGMLTKNEEDLLRCLNAGDMVPFSQFSFIGYDETASGVQFSMVHPLISFLCGTYTRDNENFSFTEVNSKFLSVLDACYKEYHDNKDAIDSVLKKIYEKHDNTLNISVGEQNRNKLVSPNNPDFQYPVIDNSFADEVNESLSNIMSKWTDPNMKFSEGVWYAVHDTDF